MPKNTALVVYTASCNQERKNYNLIIFKRTTAISKINKHFLPVHQHRAASGQVGGLTSYFSFSLCHAINTVFQMASLLAYYSFLQKTVIRHTCHMCICLVTCPGCTARIGSNNPVTLNWKSS